MSFLALEVSENPLKTEQTTLHNEIHTASPSLEAKQSLTGVRKSPARCIETEVSLPCF
jgi:hypothetical protein